MKLGVLLGSDSYTTVYQSMFEGDDEEEMTKLMNDKDFVMTEHSSEGRFVFEQDQDHWSVGQVFELNEKPYALVWHHAYDGVDFILQGQFDSYEEAVEARDRDVKQTIDTFEDPFSKVPTMEVELWDSERQAVWDTGEEWYVWSIIDVSIDNK